MVLAKPKSESSMVLIHWTWASVHAACTRLVNNADLQIIVNPDLAGQAHVRRKFGFDCETIPFELPHLTSLAFENLNPASGTTSVATTTVKNIDPCIFKRQNEFLPGRRLGFNQTSRSFSLDFRHVPPQRCK